jgi:hypothetical protein
VPRGSGGLHRGSAEKRLSCRRYIFDEARNGRSIRKKTMCFSCVNGRTYFEPKIFERVKIENKGKDFQGRSVPEEVVSAVLTPSNG